MDLSTAEEATEKESRANDASTSPGPRLTHAHDLTTGDDHDRKALVLRGEEPDEEGNPDLEIVLPEDDEWEEPPNPTHAAKTKATAANEANGNGTETNSAEAVQTNGLGNTAETNDHVNTAKAAEHPDSPSGVAETPKKKKNKRKPKSKRGLVSAVEARDINLPMLTDGNRTRLQDSRNTMWIPPLHLPNMRWKKACIMGILHSISLS